jgi:two-component system, OmpR family, phosphate regulon sensor histidine kinase PhoR
MSTQLPLAQAFLEAIDEPALLVEDDRTIAANAAARDLFGARVIGGDIRLAIRHPRGLDLILSRTGGATDISGPGAIDRPWRLIVRQLDERQQVIRLIDGSARRAAEAMRTDFVANASHELRTPLATIMGTAETLAEDGPLDEPVRQRFALAMLSEARRMLRVVEDLMSLSRIEAERFVAPTEQIDLNDLAAIALDHAGPLAEQRKAVLLAQIEPGLPRIAGDSGQLLQLLDNLLANALRYGCTGAVREVTLSITRDARSALVRVADCGEGIEPLHIPRLTERFYRVDSARSRDGGGTGLGLAIVKHIVERHRGILSIRSRPDEGTTVEVSLPLA